MKDKTMNSTTSIIDRMKYYKKSLINSGYENLSDVYDKRTQAKVKKNKHMIKKGLIMMQWYLVEADLSRAGVTEVVFNDKTDVVQFRSKHKQDYINGIFKQAGFIVDVDCKVNVASSNEMRVKFKDSSEFLCLYHVFSGRSHDSEQMFATFNSKSDPTYTHRGLINLPLSSTVAQIELITGIIEECLYQVNAIKNGRDWEVINFNTVDNVFEFIDTFNVEFAAAAGLTTTRGYQTQKLSLLRNLLALAGMKMTVDAREVRHISDVVDKVSSSKADNKASSKTSSDNEQLPANALSRLFDSKIISQWLSPYRPITSPNYKDESGDDINVESKKDAQFEVVVRITCHKTNSRIKECWAVLNDSGATDGTKSLMKHYLETCDVLSLDPDSYEGEMSKPEGGYWKELELRTIDDPIQHSIGAWSAEIQEENETRREPGTDSGTNTQTSDGDGNSVENDII